MNFLSAMLWVAIAVADTDVPVVETAPIVEVEQTASPEGELYRLVDESELKPNRRAYHPIVDATHWLTFWVNEGERMVATAIELSVFLAVAISVPVNHLFAMLGMRFRLFRKKDEFDDNEEIKLLRIQIAELSHDRAVAQKRVNLLESQLTKASQIGADQAQLLQILLTGGADDDQS